MGLQLNRRDILQILSPDKMRETMDGLLATIRYSPSAFGKTDKHGMPIIAPERDDPDDE
jgi:hypothetical protein